MKLYMDPRERRTLGGPTTVLAQRVGVELSDTPDGSAILALSDLVAQKFSRELPDQFMPAESFDRLTDKLRMHELGVPVIPSSLDPQAFSGPVFIKQRRTLKQSVPRLAYTRWDSAAEFMAAHGSEFQAFNANPENIGGELIFQPAFSYPAQGFEMNFSVNRASEVLYYSTCQNITIAPERYGFIKTTIAPQVVKDAIANIVSQQVIRSGIHCVTFVFMDGEYRLYDWNARPPFYGVLHFLSVPGFADAAMAHMCDLPVPDLPTKYFEQRGYFDSPIDSKCYPQILELGMFPRLDQTGITRVGVVTVDENTAQNLFNQMESKCVS